MSPLFLHLGILLAFPPLLLGVITKTKAFFAGRRGAPILQPYYDIFKLMRKGSVYSLTANWIFRLGPLISTVVILAAGIVLPIAIFKAPVQFSGDVILFIYLLGLARFLMVLAALDTGSSFEGMGACREATFSCLTEITIFLNLTILALLSRSLSLSGIFLGGLASSWMQVGPVLILVAASLFLVLLSENSRIPVDDPETHLELTMIHEVMVLDHSGMELGCILYTQALKLFLFGSMLVSMVLGLKMPNIYVQGLCFIPAILGLGVLIGVIESAMARLRLNRVLYLLYSALIFSIFALIVILVRGHV